MNALDHAAAVRAAVTNLEAARRNVADEAQTWRRTDQVAIWDEAAHQDATARLRDSVDRLTVAFDAWLTALHGPTRRMVAKLGPEYGDMFDREIGGGLVEAELDIIRPEDLVEVFDLPGKNRTVLSVDDVVGVLGPDRTPAEWERLLDVIVLDPDGWDRRNFAEDWARPISRTEFDAKAAISTVKRGAL